MKQIKNITPAQLKALQTIFSQKGFTTEQRSELIYNFTDGRTESSRQLTIDEARKLLSRLSRDKENSNEAKSVLAAIYKLSLDISFLNKGYSSETAEERQMNYAKINMFCRSRSRFHKNVTEMSLMELKAVKKQFEALYRKENYEKR